MSTFAPGTLVTVNANYTSHSEPESPFLGEVGRVVEDNPATVYPLEVVFVGLTGFGPEKAFCLDYAEVDPAPEGAVEGDVLAEVDE
jgi:hypothetical protein